MNTLHLFLLAIFALLAPKCSSAAARNLELESPTTKIYEVDEGNNVLRPWDKIDSQRSETTIEDVDHLRLECTAYHPVQFFYIGNGIPLLSSNISLSSNQKRRSGVTEYKATALLSPLKEQHTGKYQCSHTAYIDLSTYLYIYVPGQQLFTSLKGKTLYIPKNDSSVLIPCSVSNPITQVSLEKYDGEILRKPITKSKDAIVYDPREGFRVQTRQIENPEGTYVCTARYANLVRGVEYTVTSHFGPASEAIVDEQQNPADNDCDHETCKRRCDSHTDCPSTMSCYTDRMCRNPCIHSIRCGTAAMCKVVKQRPECYCPKDFVGDPMKQCFSSVQGTATANPSVTEKTKRPACTSDSDCPKDRQCSKTTSGCVDPCTIKNCGLNSKCVIENRVASCYCLRGFVGDANKRCEPIKEVELISPNETRVQQSATSTKKSCRRSEDCGAFSECKDGQCTCKAGYTGTHPNCVQEDEEDDSIIHCDNNRDCETDQVCAKTDPSRNSSCVDVCGSRICGPSAICYKDTSTPFCMCPAGFTGNPYEHCKDETSKLGRDCTIDSQCGSKLRCETGASYRKCSDPCVRRTCPSDQECIVDRHVATCKCARGYTGSAQIGCTKDLVLEKLVEGGCSALNCGLNSDCRIKNGNPSCSCQSGYIGIPPFCRRECITHLDCRSEQVCLSNRCHNGCTNKCGKNARCRLALVTRSPICECPQGFEGKAEVECTRKIEP